MNPADFTYFGSVNGYDWVSVFGVSNYDFQNQQERILHLMTKMRLNRVMSVLPERPLESLIGRHYFTGLSEALFRMVILFIRS